MRTYSRSIVGYPFALLLSLTLFGCGGGGGDGASPPPPPVQTLAFIHGSAIKSTISGAELKLYKFDASGDLVEVVAQNAPVLTEADGGFRFSVQASDIGSGVGPLLLKTSGGQMNAEAAPHLASLIADSTPLGTGGASIYSYVTAASSVAAVMLERTAGQSGSAPAGSDANTMISRVETALGVDLATDPSTVNSGIDFLNSGIDANLNLVAVPQNNPAVNDLIEYLALNLMSDSKKFDSRMVHPDDPANISHPATFEGVSDGMLANLIPGGPSNYYFFRASIDKESIENDGMDTAVLSASLMDGTGAMVNAVPLDVHTAAGRLTISKNNPHVDHGEATTYLSSVWAGAATVSVGLDVPAGTSIVHAFDLTVANDEADVADSTSPRIVSAGSTGNKTVLVSFTEAMRGGIESAENPAHYRIIASEPLASSGDGVQKPGSGDDPDAEKPEVLIEDAQLVLPDRKTVRLTTMAQSDLAYEVSVTNLVDLAGNSMAPPDGSVNPSMASFQGTPPSGNEIADSDGDGLSDADEQRGWIVTTITADGVEMTFEVTSDPTNPDTDGDGISDADEYQGGMHPRTADSDGDTLTDHQEWFVIHSNALNQDTDGDGMQDGFEYKVLRTSPILADTDGDQISDPIEVAAGNRNPLISDLPSPRVSIGNVNLQLDTRFSFTNEAGESVTEEKSFESMITRGEDDTYSTSNTRSTKSTLETSQQLQTTIKVGAKELFGGAEFQRSFGSKQGSERGNTFTTGRESSRSSEEAYHDSLTTSTQRDKRESVTREVTDATVKVDVSIDNVGDMPFTISNLELSAQVQDPLDRRRMIPVAALVPENEGLGSINIGALGDPSRGPFIFKTVSVFPQQVQELMKNPRGLIVQLANFDITDNQGNNFAYTSQDVLDRTAGITFDLGDGRVENYRIATNGDHDPFTGRALGITLEYALRIVGYHRYDTIRDGGNGVMETVALGDDEQLGSLGSAIEPGKALVTAGANGLIDSLAQGDDVLVAPDYETRMQYGFDYIADGADGVASTYAEGDDTQLIEVGEDVAAGDPIIGTGPNGILDTVLTSGDDVIVESNYLPHRVLTRFRDVAANPDTKRFWALFMSRARPGVDLENYDVRSGDQFDFAYVQDKDDDGVWAREEYLHGSSDLLANSDGCNLTNPPDPCDSLSDKEEIQEGWIVQLRGSPQGVRVYPNPVQGDSDRDLLVDDEERSCLLDPRQRDTDLDGLTDYEELYGKRIVDGVETDMTSRDYDTNIIRYVITPYAGAEDPSGTGVFPHDVIDGCKVDGFATDPLKADTDGDLVDDAIELLLGLNPNDSSDGPSYLDDDGDGLPNQVELDGWLTIVNGVEIRVTSNPNSADSDKDLLPDLLEYYIGSHPGLMDTDGDQLTDTNEYKSGGFACVTYVQGVVCNDFADRPEMSYLEYLNKCAAAAVCNNTAIEQNLENANAKQLGTNLSEADSDFDLLDDPFELEKRTIEVNGQFDSEITSNPIEENSDTDFLDDYEEFVAGTDPRKADTDGDGMPDHAEEALSRDPTFRDKAVTLTVPYVLVTNVDDEGTLGCNKIEPYWVAEIDPGTGVFQQVSTASGYQVDNNETITPDPTLLYDGVIRDDGTVVRLRISGTEYDDNEPAGCVNSGNETLETKSISFDYDTETYDDDIVQDFDYETGTLTTKLQVVVQ